MICASLLVTPLLITTEMGHSGDLSPEPMLDSHSCVQGLLAGSNVDGRSYYCLISISAGVFAVAIQAICALVDLPVLRHPKCCPGPVKSISQLSHCTWSCGQWKFR